MIINLPRFGTGIAPIFRGSPMNVPPVAGRLRMAAGNILANRNTVQRMVARGNAKAIQDAKKTSNLINLKA